MLTLFLFAQISMFLSEKLYRKSVNDVAESSIFKGLGVSKMLTEKFLHQKS